MRFLFHLLMTAITGGLWLIVLLIWYMTRKD